MRVELSEKVGLTDRQLLMWFCYRRLKDKNESVAPKKIMQLQVIIQTEPFCQKPNYSQVAASVRAIGDYLKQLGEPPCQVEAKKVVPRDNHNVFIRSNSSSHRSPSPTLIRTKKIFVGGLASTVTESDFKNYFDQYGTITDVIVMYDHNTQRPRGFGFITFDSEESVEKVLHKTFPELNGKMVEVKRVVPKELSPGPSRGQLGGFSYATINRVSSFSNGFTQGYNPNLIGGHELRIDGRLSPANVGRNGYTLFSPSYGTRLNFEPPLNENENLPNFVMGRALSSPYSASSSRYNNAMG